MVCVSTGLNKYLDLLFQIPHEVGLLGAGPSDRLHFKPYEANYEGDYEGRPSYVWQTASAGRWLLAPPQCTSSFSFYLHPFFIQKIGTNSALAGLPRQTEAPCNPSQEACLSSWVLLGAGAPDRKKEQRCSYFLGKYSAS